MEVMKNGIKAQMRGTCLVVIPKPQICIEFPWPISSERVYAHKMFVSRSSRTYASS